jgi:hypothetical protein
MFSFSNVLFEIANMEKKLSIVNNHRLTQNILHFLTAAGWILFTFGVIQFPLWALLVILKKRKGTFLEVSYHMHRQNIIMDRGLITKNM